MAILFVFVCEGMLPKSQAADPLAKESPVSPRYAFLVDFCKAKSDVHQNIHIKIKIKQLWVRFIAYYINHVSLTQEL